MHNFWSILTLEPTKDEKAIKKAYRSLLPKFHPETDPTGFKALREAYEAALHYAQSPDQIDPPALKNNDDGESTVNDLQILVNLNALLDDPLRRFSVNAWQDWIFNDVNELSLDEMEKAQFQILQTLINHESLLSYPCARVVIKRFDWQEYYENFHDAESRHIVLNFLETCEKDNLFDYSVLKDYPYIVQNKIIAYYAACNGLSRSSALFYLQGLLENHHALPVPNDPYLIVKIAHWHMLINAPSIPILDALLTYREKVTEESALKDIDYLINFHQTVLGDHYIELLTELNPHFHISTAFKCYKENANFYPFVYLAQFFKRCTKNATLDQSISFDPQIEISLPLSIIPKENLREDVIFMIEDYWHSNHTIEFIRSGIIEQPSHMIDALLYAVWVIKYGDEWSLANFITIYYEYEHPIANFLLLEFQKSAALLLSLFRRSRAIQATKALLNLYGANGGFVPENFVEDDNDKKLVKFWLNRLHPYQSSPLEVLMAHDITVSNKHAVVNSYLSYLFLLQGNRLQNIQATEEKINLWRAQQYLMLAFIHVKDVGYYLHYKDLIVQSPKTHIPWFDRAFALLKKVSKNSHLREVDFWQDFIAQDLKKQPKFANMFYPQHFNSLYIADNYLSKVETVDYIYTIACDYMIHNGLQSVNDATLLLSYTLLNTKTHLLAQDKRDRLQALVKYSLHHSHESIQETHRIYQQIIDDGRITTDSNDWVYPYNFLLKSIHKLTHKKAFTKDDTRQLKELQDSTEHSMVLCLSARLILFNRPSLIMADHDLVVLNQKVPTPLAWIVRLFSFKGEISRLEYLISLTVLFLPFILYMYTQPLQREIFNDAFMMSTPLLTFASFTDEFPIHFLLLIPFHWALFATNLRRTRRATHQVVLTMCFVTVFSLLGIIFLLCKDDKNK